MSIDTYASVLARARVYVCDTQVFIVCEHRRTCDIKHSTLFPHNTYYHADPPQRVETFSTRARRVSRTYAHVCTIWTGGARLFGFAPYGRRFRYHYWLPIILKFRSIIFHFVF